MSQITFYVGAAKTESLKLFKQLKSIKCLEILNNYDDPYGYYEFVCKGSWDTYKKISTSPYVKSLSHFEEDV
jgi:hypothetical protein